MMGKKSNSARSEKGGFGLRQCLGVAGVILAAVLIWTLFKMGMSIHQNRKIYDAVVNFVPTENSRIEVERWEAGRESHTPITLSSAAAQQAAMEVLSQLEYGGFYLYSDSFSPVERWKAISVDDQGGHYYLVTLYPDGAEHLTAWISVGSSQSYDLFSQLYKLKYDNWEPVRTYFDQFWAENAPTYGAEF